MPNFLLIFISCFTDSTVHCHHKSTL